MLKITCKNSATIIIDGSITAVKGETITLSSSSRFAAIEGVVNISAAEGKSTIVRNVSFIETIE